MSTTITLDTTGLKCPEPIILLHNAVRDAAIADVVYLISTDPSSERDVLKFCTFLGHALLDSEVTGEVYHFKIKKQ